MLVVVCVIVFVVVILLNRGVIIFVIFCLINFWFELCLVLVMLLVIMVESKDLIVFNIVIVKVGLIS